MNHFELICDYKDIDQYRLSFNKLANHTFGIDFEKWYQHGFWNNTYVCYSYIDHNEVISNVSVSKLNVIIDGKEHKALQVGTVMTRPDYRGNGLSRSLMEIVLKEYEPQCDFIYLFANKTVLEFYPKFGFQRMEQCHFSTDVGLKKGNGKARKLDITNEDDREIVRKLSQERIPVSQILSVKNGGAILAWYCFNVYNENLYYLKEDDVMVIYNIEGEVLHLYDIVSRNKIELNHILEKIIDNKVKKVIFYYTPDYAGIQLHQEVCNDSDDTLFVKPFVLNIPNGLAYPITAHS
jgi:predicted GNAT family N-acyltransferase